MILKVFLNYSRTFIILSKLNGIDGPTTCLLGGLEWARNDQGAACTKAAKLPGNHSKNHPTKYKSISFGLKWPTILDVGRIVVYKSLLVVFCVCSLYLSKVADIIHYHALWENRRSVWTTWPVPSYRYVKNDEEIIIERIRETTYFSASKFMINNII